MNNKQPLVSICIPTYNRAPYLKKGLDSIVCLPEFLDGTVNVWISDNCSTDDTEQLCKQYSGKYNGIHYHRNNTNVVNENFSIVMSLADGVLLKLCNDTVIYNSNALKIFCDACIKYREEKPLLFFANNDQVILRKNNNQDILSFEDFYLKVSYVSTYSVYFSLWKEDFNLFGADRSGAELYLWQVSQICKVLNHKNRGVVIPDLFCDVQIVDKKDISYGLYQVFYVNYLSILKPYVDSGKISKQCYELQRRELLLDFFPSWIAKWKMQEKSLCYSGEEDLKQKVVEAYKNDSYLNQFFALYKKILFKLIIKKYFGRLVKLYKIIFNKKN